MKENKLLPGIFSVGLGLWAEKDKALVIGDLHLGIEEMFNSQGMLLPRHNFSDIKKHLGERVFSKARPELVVINGDLKHEFGSISEQEWHEVIDILRFLQAHCKKLVLVRGNHDSILGPIANWEGLKIEKEGVLLKKSNVFVAHGGKIPESPGFKAAKTVVVGHGHPAVTIREQYKSELFKCFLVGKFKGKKLVVMPSMNTVSIGTDVRDEKPLGPFLAGRLDRFRVFAIADKTYDFGLLKDLD